MELLFHGLHNTRDCVIAIPTIDRLDRVVGIGTCSGADTDRFAKFKPTAVPGKFVKAPLIKECLTKIECKVVDGALISCSSPGTGLGPAVGIEQSKGT